MQQQEIKTKIEEKERGITINTPSKKTPVPHHPFMKTDKERGQLATEKKKHNKEFHKIFGTKRPTAGVVKRYLTETKFA